jgi:hypothetical protein
MMVDSRSADYQDEAKKNRGGHPIQLVIIQLLLSNRWWCNRRWTSRRMKTEKEKKNEEESSMEFERRISKHRTFGR